MSRLKHFSRSLLSGYAGLAANTLLALASIPLALRHLTTEEFGAWAVAAQIAGYMALIDLGMTGALARTLIETKDDRTSSGYGSTIVASLLVGVSQAVLALVIAAIIAPLASPIAKIPSQLTAVFHELILWQGLLLAVSLLTRIFSVILTAHHRFDVVNYIQIGAAMANFGIMWIFFRGGKGIFAMVYGQLAGLCVVVTWTALSCLALRLLPTRSAYKRPTWRQFTDLFSFGKDVFGYSLGHQLINASQTLIITRVLGLDAGAVWSVCTRTYSLLLQLIHRLFDYSTSALSEMLIRGERDRLFARFRDLTTFSGVLGTVGGVIFASTNTSFVTMWTKGEISWHMSNDMLLAALCFVAVVQRAHTTLLGVRKHMAFIKYVYLAEGICFVITGFFLARSHGFAGILLSSIVCTCLFSLTYNLKQTRRFFSLRTSELLSWFAPPLRCAAALGPIAVIVCLLTADSSAAVAFSIRLSVLGVASMIVTWRLGIPEHLKREALVRFKSRLRPTSKPARQTKCGF